MSHGLFDAAVNEVLRALRGIDPEQLQNAVAMIRRAPRVYLAGCGRSGYMMRAFTMRLMHMGLSACFVGDTCTPAARAGDLLVVGSGSGETGSLKYCAASAKALGMELLALTGKPGSTVGRMADALVVIPSGTPGKRPDGSLVLPSDARPEENSVLVMGSVAEISLLICTDALVSLLMEELGVSPDEMARRHANLE